MSSHFAVLGMNVHNGEDLASIVDAVLGTGEVVEVGPGTEDLLWTDPSGAALMLELVGTSVSGVLPCFIGGGLVSVRGIALVADDPDTATMEVLDESGELCYPVGVELIERGVLRAEGGTLDFGQVAITGLAETITVHADAVAFEAAGSKFAVNAFVPSGLFVADEGATPTAHAVVNGVVRAADELVNELTGVPFVRLVVATYGMDELEIVAARTDVAALPEPGAVVETTLFLTGRLVAG
jgi:hypothetical protein